MDINALMNQAFTPLADPFAQDFGVLPAGDYQLELVACKVEGTKAGNGIRVSLDWRVLGDADGKYAGRRFFPNHNIVNASPIAVQNARKALSQLLELAGHVEAVPNLKAFEGILLPGLTVSANIRVSQDGQNNFVATYGETKTVEIPQASADAEDLFGDDEIPF